MFPSAVFLKENMIKLVLVMGKLQRKVPECRFHVCGDFLKKHVGVMLCHLSSMHLRSLVKRLAYICQKTCQAVAFAYLLAQCGTVL